MPFFFIVSFFTVSFFYCFFVLFYDYYFFLFLFFPRAPAEAETKKKNSATAATSVCGQRRERPPNGCFDRRKSFSFAFYGLHCCCCDVTALLFLASTSLLSPPHPLFIPFSALAGLQYSARPRVSLPTRTITARRSRAAEGMAGGRRQWPCSGGCERGESPPTR